jgi:hypothetical protein
MNCSVLSPAQFNPTNRITVLTEKLPQETGDMHFFLFALAVLAT